LLKQTSLLNLYRLLKNCIFSSTTFYFKPPCKLTTYQINVKADKIKQQPTKPSMFFLLKALIECERFHKISK